MASTVSRAFRRSPPIERGGVVILSWLGFQPSGWRSALAYRMGQKAHLASAARALSGLLAGDEAPAAKDIRDVLRALRSEEEPG